MSKHRISWLVCVSTIFRGSATRHLRERKKFSSKKWKESNCFSTLFLKDFADILKKAIYRNGTSDCLAWTSLLFFSTVYHCRTTFTLNGGDAVHDESVKNKWLWDCLKNGWTWKNWWVKHKTGVLCQALIVHCVTEIWNAWNGVNLWLNTCK